MHIRNGFITDVCLAMMWVGSTLIGMGLAALSVLTVCAARRRPLVFVGAGFAVVGAVVTCLVLKSFIQRPRPFAYSMVITNGYSMPSSSAALSAGLFGALLALGRTSRQRWVLGFGLGVVQVVNMFAVCYLGTHWLTDTLVGTTIGGAWGICAGTLLTRYYDARALGEPEGQPVGAGA